jgi:hypothetical protein
LTPKIRRLRAELDEIRARAKKKFYRAESAAVGVRSGKSASCRIRFL